MMSYGHVGYFDVIRGNSYDYNSALGYYRQTGQQELAVLYRPSDYNPALAAITNQYFTLFDRNPFITNLYTQPNGSIQRDPTQLFVTSNIAAGIALDPYASLTNIQGGNGLINGFSPSEVYNLWNYAGAEDSKFNSTRYSKSDRSQFRVSAQGSADIGDHALQIGFEFEQRNDAGYSIAPISLWQLARLYTNAHINEFDFKGDSTIVNHNGATYVYFDRLLGDNQYEFDYNLRNSLGLDPRGTDFINIYNLDPSQININMFGAEDLLNQGNNLVTYYGYDHAGNRNRNSASIDDFFSQQYKLGSSSYYTRPISAFQPVYIAGYVMDKFAFDDLIFNVGLRVDRFDANQYVPKDPYVISEARTAAEVDYSKFTQNRPDNIGDDYVVYVNDLKNPTSITGYRNGDVWYSATGTRLDSPDAIIGASGGKAKPYLLVDPNAKLTKNAFKEYTPAVNIMPRIAFSFPISDEALFFAHYDVLTQRPTEGNRFNPIDYLYLATNRNVLMNNPNLRPERTVDYALGFQQILSRSSSLKVEAFYRELRDMVQVRSYVGAYPSTYRTYGNLDFGTVKGLTLTYDLRRTGNFWMKANYTLQFADGTGSTTSTQLALINAGLPNLRTVSPFNYDQRHRFVVTADYHYGQGADYNGPVLFGKRILESAGINMIANLGSGTPYTPQRLATPITGEVSPQTQGSLNGARLPGQFTIDMNIDKSFTLKFGGEGDKAKEAYLNVYFWISNLLNTRNINDVYRFTGVWNDDGYLAAAQFQSLINSQVDPNSFRNYYSMYVNNPFNLGAPRQIRLGMSLSF
jgi:hypothetical protein